MTNQDYTARLIAGFDRTVERARVALDNEVPGLCWRLDRYEEAIKETQQGLVGDKLQVAIATSMCFGLF